MARKRIEPRSALKDWEDVDQALAEIARLDRELALLEIKREALAELEAK